MADQSNNESGRVDDLLVPPPFGVAETTGEQLLPIATSMDTVLDRPISEVEAEAESRALQAAAVEQARVQQSEPPPPAPVPVQRAPAPPIAAPQPAPVVSESSNGKRIGLVVIAALLLVGAVGGLAYATTDKPASEGQAAVPAKSEPKESSPKPPPPPQKPPAPVEAVDDVAELPTTLEALREVSYADRHAGLKNATGDVPVELHVGLDLVQAAESASPCTTFSDALSTIESSPDPSVYAWAIDEAVAPADDDEAACARLDTRLKALKASLAPPAEAKSADARRPRPSPKPRKARPTPAPAPQPRKPLPPRQEPPKRAPSVATKLDDDLKGLGE